MKYDLIIFDADETLFDFKKSERVAFEQTIINFGIDYKKEVHFDAYKKINAKIWKEFEEGLITQTKLKIERFKRFSDKLELGLDAEKFANTYMENLANASYIYADAFPLLDSLKDSAKLSIITNGLTKVQETRIRKSEIANYFEDIVISEEIDMAKPSKEIFDYATKRLDISDKKRILMVGDSLTSDIQGGNNFGIDTCWFNAKEIINEKGITPTYEIKKLDELLTCIK